MWQAYGVDVATETGYVYKKTEKIEAPDNSAAKAKIDFDGVPFLAEVIWEESHGNLVSESQMIEPASFADTILRKKKDRRRHLKNDSGESPSWLHNSIPVLNVGTHMATSCNKGHAVFWHHCFDVGGRTNQQPQEGIRFHKGKPPEKGG